jgi:hypothetical protein
VEFDRIKGNPKRQTLELTDAKAAAGFSRQELGFNQLLTLLLW